MIKLDLLKDSLNYNSSEISENDIKQELEDFSDLNFGDSDGETKNTEDFAALQNQPSADLTSEVIDEKVPEEESLLSDLGLDEDTQVNVPANEAILTTQEEKPDIFAEATEKMEEKPGTEEPVAEEQPGGNPFLSGKTEEKDSPFDFSGSNEDYGEYDEDEYESVKSGKGKLIFIIVLFLILGGGAAYYFLFYNKSVTEETAKTANSEQTAAEPGSIEAERIKKLNQLKDFWIKNAQQSHTITNAVSKFPLLPQKGFYFSMIRYRDGKLIFTVVADNRDKLAKLNVKLKNSLNIVNYDYLSVVPMKIGNGVKISGDVSMQLIPMKSAGLNIDVNNHLNQTPSDVQKYFTQNGLINVKFNYQPKSSSNPLVKKTVCELIGKGNFDKINNALGQITAKFPQVKITKFYIFSQNQRSVSGSTVSFDLNFEFYQSTL